ncbi:MAG: aminopeptidase P family protein [Oscillospiraceae bacterium]|nr:aminopeptidase P family protein [Oscillospiraceae bacterium]
MNHLEKISAQLPSFELDAMLITSGPGERYAVGFHGEGTVVAGPKECFYHTDSRYIESANNQVTGAVIRMSTTASNHKVLVKEALEKLGAKKVGFEDGYMSVFDYNDWKKALPDVELVPAQALVNDLRASKDAGELEIMTRAQRITEQAFDEILSVLTPGMTEQDIAARLTYYMMRFGAEKNSFDPIVVSGPNGSLPHGIPSQKTVQEGEFITMDFGAMVDGYCADMTRTVVLGKPTDEMRKVYDTVLEAQLAGIAASKAGMIGCDIDAVARKVITDAGYGDYFGHGYGHSLGIEIHELPGAGPTSKKPLPVGAVVSAEPGIYLPGRFGVRIEDVAVMEEGGCTVLTKAPKELILL